VAGGDAERGQKPPAKAAEHGITCVGGDSVEDRFAALEKEEEIDQLLKDLKEKRAG
jgi:hypothetical protein